MSSSSNDDFIPAMMVLVTIAGGLGVWKFSEALGLPWESGLRILVGMVITSAVAGGYKYFTRYSYNFFPIFPLFILGIYISWFPAFDHWGAITDTYQEVWSGYGVNEVTGTAWYARWYTKILVSIAILWVGYFGVPKLKELL